MHSCRPEKLVPTCEGFVGCKFVSRVSTRFHWISSTGMGPMLDAKDRCRRKREGSYSLIGEIITVINKYLSR